MHPVWIILISVAINIIASIIICKIINSQFKCDLEIERQLRELKKVEEERKQLECVLIDILESPFTLINKQKPGNPSEDAPEDDSSTEW